MAGNISTTRAELRRRVGLRLGDCTPLTATDAGTTTRLVDTVRLARGIERANGRDIVFTSGDNAGLVRRVTTADMSAGYVNFDDVTAVTVAGDTAELYNFRGKGWIVPEYDAALQQAQDTAWPAHKVETAANVAAVFDQTSGLVTVPATLTHVYEVQYQDTDNRWQTIPQATTRYGAGWTMAPGGQIEIRGGSWSYVANGKSLRCLGYSRETAFTADTSTTEIDPEWLVLTAAAILCMSALDRNDQNYNRSLVLQQRADAIAPSIRTRLRSAARKVLP